MPQLRSFGNFASTPGVGSAFVGGMGVEQRSQEVAQQAQTARAQMANQYAIASMEAAVKQQQLQQQALQAAQELEVQKSIKQQQIGLQMQELQQKEAFDNQQLSLTGQHYDTEAKRVQSVTDAAAHEYEAKQRQRMMVEDLMKQPGMTPEKAVDQASAIWGAQAGSDIRKISPRATAQGKDALDRPVAMPLLDEDGNPTGETIYKSSLNQYSRVPKSAATDTEASFVPGSEGQLMKFNKKYFPNPKLGDVKDLTKERDALKKQLDGSDFDLEKRMWTRSKNPKDELSDTQKALAQKYVEAMTELQKMNAAITSAKQGIRDSAQKAFRPPGLDLGSSTNNAPKRIKYNPATRSFQ